MNEPSREDRFIERWIESELGMALRGIVHDTDERLKGPHTAGRYALGLEHKLRERLRRLFRDAQPAGTTAPAGTATNGQAPAKEGPKRS